MEWEAALIQKLLSHKKLKSNRSKLSADPKPGSAISYLVESQNNLLKYCSLLIRFKETVFSDAQNSFPLVVR